MQPNSHIAVAGPNKAYRSSKTFGHELGLSCCFRQWRAVHSHCQFMHGYALKIHLEFMTTNLDYRNWVVDFGALSEIKAWLQYMFDHKTLVATDDPKISIFRELAIAGLIQLVEVEGVGCEGFSRLIYEFVEKWLVVNFPHATLLFVTVSEHGANSASYGVD